MTTILVTGGAGYIGSHMAMQLLEAGFEVVTLDDLSGGRREAVTGGSFVRGDIGDSQLVRRVLAEHRVSAVMNFASYIAVSESMADPLKYYRNNLAGTVRLLDAM